MAVNITITDVSSPGFAVAYPATWGGNNSDLNTTPGLTSTNLVIVKLAPDGTFKIANSAGSVNVIVDLEGWYR